MHECVPDLLQAYPHFTVDAVKRDPKCIEALAVYERNTKLGECVQAALAGRRDGNQP